MQGNRVNAVTVLAVASGLLLALAGCVPAAPADTSATPHTGSTSASPSPTPTPGASGSPEPGAAPTPAPAPSAPAGPPTASDPAGGKALAVQACQAIAGGFAAGSVAQAAPLAARAAADDPLWSPLAGDLDFIQKNPIDPNTGQGPQQTADDAAAAAHDCFTLAGVQVSQD